MQFFDEREGMLRAQMTYIQVDEKNWIPVPLISLVSPRNYTLDRMKVAMSVRIDQNTLKQATIDADGSMADRASFKVSLSPKEGDTDEKRPSDVTNIEMEFVAGNPPEAIMRVIDTFTNLIDTKSMATPPPHNRFPNTPMTLSGTKLSKKAKTKEPGSKPDTGPESGENNEG